MLQDLTEIDSFGWTALKGALNQRLVVTAVRFVPGKANRVWIVETNVRPVVVKRFLTDGCPNEFESLLQARKAGLDVPFPMSAGNNTIIMEYIPGDTCDRLVNQMFSSAAATGMGRWLFQYHNLAEDGEKRRLMGDTTLSNFILSEGRIFGLDLEDSRLGNPLDDLGQLAASMLASEPFFTPIKFDLCLRMLESYEKNSSSRVVEAVRPHIAMNLRLQARAKPLFRRIFHSAAKTLEEEWPTVAR
ncbi:MAG TPA: hypothetical protein VGB78_10135 [Thermoplasmata archaeon]